MCVYFFFFFFTDILPNIIYIYRERELGRNRDYKDDVPSPIPFRSGEKKEEERE